MKTSIKLGLCFIASTSVFFGKECPEEIGKYGNMKQYQNMFCRVMIAAERKDDKSYRNLTFTDEGLIQVFSNFPGTTNSNSTGARVYYLFPFKTQKKINEANESGLKMTHTSGAKLNFDQNGKMSSPDLVMKVDSDVNSKNKSGIEIESFSKGLVVDLGYRMGNTPTLNKDAVATITDKNKKKCTMKNSDINKITKDEVQLIYKTNEALHGFLSKKCPGLDISDLMKPMEEDVKVVQKAKQIGQAPKADGNSVENNW